MGSLHRFVVGINNIERHRRRQLPFEAFNTPSHSSGTVGGPGPRPARRPAARPLVKLFGLIGDTVVLPSEWAPACREPDHPTPSGRTHAHFPPALLLPAQGLRVVVRPPALRRGGHHPRREPAEPVPGDHRPGEARRRGAGRAHHPSRPRHPAGRDPAPLRPGGRSGRRVLQRRRHQPGRRPDRVDAPGNNPDPRPLHGPGGPRRPSRRTARPAPRAARDGHRRHPRHAGPGPPRRGHHRHRRRSPSHRGRAHVRRAARRPGPPGSPLGRAR